MRRRRLMETRLMLNTPSPANADETDVLETQATSTMAVFDTGFNELTPASFAFLAGAEFCLNRQNCSNPLSPVFDVRRSSRS